MSAIFKLYLNLAMCIMFILNHHKRVNLESRFSQDGVAVSSLFLFLKNFGQNDS